MCKVFEIYLYICGGLVGLAINYLELQNKEQQIREYQVEIDGLKETVYILKGEKEL